jgi:dTDP-glucose 4,6-dehydratase
VLAGGRLGETYNVGGTAERRNLDVVKRVCAILDELRPRTSGRREALINFVTDRPGHDWRYAMDTRKIERELGWRPQESFESGLRKTVEWYLTNADWVAAVRSGEYRKWIETNYGSRG